MSSLLCVKIVHTFWSIPDKKILEFKLSYNRKHCYIVLYVEEILAQKPGIPTTPPKKWITEDQRLFKIVVFFSKSRTEFSEATANVVENRVDPRIKSRFEKNYKTRYKSSF